jgi:DeoR/GlpR family transcriptional regulator of sugar metabolism
MPILLGVSAETIRRDLRVLESRGLIRRAYGVAYPVESSAFESALAMRSNINPEEKVRVANAMKASRRRIFIGAHHKFGRTTFVKFAAVQDFELLITGHELSNSIASRYAAAGVSLLRV